MDHNATRGGYDKVHYLWTDKSHTVVVLNQAGGPYRNVALHYLHRAVASCSGEENDWFTSGGLREEFRGVL